MSSNEMSDLENDIEKSVEQTLKARKKRLKYLHHKVWLAFKFVLKSILNILVYPIMAIFGGGKK